MRRELSKLALACASASALATMTGAARAQSSLPSLPAPAPPATAPATGGDAIPAPGPPAETVSKVVLHVDGPAEVEVYGRPNGDYEWVPVCHGSCNARVVDDWEYQIRGDGLRTSRPFLVQGARGEDVTVHVDAASQGWFVGGLIAVIGGVVVAEIGIDVVSLGALWNGASSGGTTTSSGIALRNDGSDAVTVGTVMLIVGGVALVGGGIAALTNWSTNVRREGNEANARLLPPTPTWRTLEAQETRLPTPIGAPLLQMRF
jgi:hypothetical protein